MYKVTLPDTPYCKLPFFLAVEEWIARNMPPGEYFFAWRVSPTVICGRNQDVAAEVNLDYCSKEGIEVYRRKSGGGAVFADSHNIMFSYIATSTYVQTAFYNYTSRVVSALQELGLGTETTGRNDIAIGGRKVAGNAYWQCEGRSIVHGTMLYDADVRHMSCALTPEKAKLEAHKVLSVPSRITTIREYRPDISLEKFVEHMYASICDEECKLPEYCLPQILELEKQYYKESFASLKKCRSSRRIDGVGCIGVDVTLCHDGRIKSVSLHGDFFSSIDISFVERRMKGTLATLENIEKALGDMPVVVGMNNSELALLIEKTATNL